MDGRIHGTVQPIGSDFLKYAIGLLGAWCALLVLVYYMIPDPVMDEIFHIPQAQRYCRFNFEMDPLITTPPGLYLSVLPQVVSLGLVVPKKIICSTIALRATNVIFALANFLAMYLCLDVINSEGKVAQRVGWQTRRPRAMKEAVALSLFPPLFFFYTLYYTDVAATAFVFWAYYQCLQGNHINSSIIGFCGLLFRQTNIVWVAFNMGVAALRVIEKEDPRMDRIVYNQHGVMDQVNMAIRSMMVNKGTVMGTIWPYFPVLGAFLLFLIVNGGIVLGDHEHHIASVHIPQMFYFFVTCCAFASPYILMGRYRDHLVSWISGILRSPVKLITFCLTCVGVAMIVRFFTYVHPFLLADNRHFTFYIWRRLLNFTWWARYLYVPVYIVAAKVVWDLLGEQTATWRLGFLATVALMVVPQALLETRYFIIPYLMFRLHMNLAERQFEQMVVIEALFSIVINLGVYYFFLFRPFTWPDGTVQHFMW
eukprot:Clim_evm3s63 gene=Clim_evmTU3s63